MAGFARKKGRDIAVDYKIISENVVTVLIHKGEDISPEQARREVLHALAVCGYEPWRSMCLELFSGKEGDLMLASRAGSPAL